MKYLVKGTDTYMSDETMFEWIVEAESEREAEQKALEDLSAKAKISEIKHLSPQEAADIEYRTLTQDVRYFYLLHLLGDIPFMQYNQKAKELEQDPCFLYNALSFYNKYMRCMRMIHRITKKEITVADAEKATDRLMKAVSEEEFIGTLESIRREQTAKTAQGEN